MGRLTAVNTLGAVLGSLATGYVLLPWLGSQRALMAFAFIFVLGDPEPVETVETIPGLDKGQRDMILGGNFTSILEGMRR